ncbi:hypothetical protein VOLCADRAFT_109718 [Volvox carteri f. nagariensis]|uniref:glucose-6-phosphate 1-epimerase n=1 Tax=Volvox carteri f. nagariensis TaxID=3068 RepID=D8TST4_VOLCA|nr:uncharacterized protein VOLCADRAFT_109718 [Volvox carteri f. nagariensis]EFJ49540.1 hypothetical protein VOLCADRAFT_109718 [Volvox carteri f. nagariensis]|eukprot:XP_002949521.1 hypothetical protein VOLCADRAFT_109718 [Volvox carteri f. nagariensis]
MAFSSMRSTMRCGARPCLRTPAKAARRTTTIVASSVSELNTKYGIPGSVEFKEGKSGSPVVVLKHACGSTAEMYLFGACVTSWKQPSGDEILYVRPDAVFDKSKPISGGVPHCFPQFGPGPMQQHGFARNLDWGVSATSADPNPDDKDPAVEVVLTESEYTLKMWPYKFKAVYSVSLHGEQLNCQLRVINTDDKPFDFTAALHTYIEVLAIEKAKVTGLKGLTYLCKAKDPKNPETKTEDRDEITFTGYTDSVYLNSPSHVELEVGTGAAVALDSSGWEDTVVWNPFTTMKDCYQSFCCVENAKFGKPAVVAPGESWSATVTMSVVDVTQ